MMFPRELGVIPRALTGSTPPSSLRAFSPRRLLKNALAVVPPAAGVTRPIFTQAVEMALAALIMFEQAVDLFEGLACRRK